MTVTVVIPAYNESANIRRAIDSVIEQTYGDLECLVVDDGSTDDTVSKVESYVDGRVRCIQHSKNRGRSAARNTGIGAASGEYLAFLDADDEWMPNKIKHQVQYLESKPDSWVAVYSDVTQQRKNLPEQFAEVIFKSAEKKEGGSELIKDVLSTRVSIHPGSTLLVESEIAKSVGGFDESLSINEDLAFIIEVLKNGKLAYYNQPLSVIHRSNYPEAITVKREKEKFLNKFSEQVCKLESNGYSVISKHNHVIGKAYLREGKLRKGLSYQRNACVESVEEFAGIVWSLSIGLKNLRN